MIFSFLGVAMSGVLAASLVLIAFRTIRRPAPRWAYPAAAGAAMLAFTLYLDYSWFSRTRDALPPRVAVATTYTQTNPLQPWTYLVAPVNRFVAVDRERVLRSPEAEALALAEVALVARHMPTATARFIYDCETPRRADAADVTGFDEAGAPVGARWFELPADDPIRRVVCETARPATS